MKVSILASTNPGYKLTKDEALKFGGKSAGICYMPDDIEALFSEPEEKTIRRANMTLNSGHHSVFDHTSYNLALEGIPKILAMILNNEGMYTTSEKSARYTKMQPSEQEKNVYEKWIEIYKKEISKVYPQIDEKKVKKLAQENARYLISIFTPATTMEYTVSLRQLNYIAHWFEDYIKNEDDNEFNKKLKSYMKEFLDCISDLIIPELNSDAKMRKISLFDERKSRKEEFGEERGTAENFILKCKERVCGCAQLEIMKQTYEILNKYIEKTKETNEEIYNYLLPYAKGARCTYPGFKCTNVCMWGAKNALTRKI